MPMIFLLTDPSTAQDPESYKILRNLTEQRQALTKELEQFQRTINLVHPENIPAAQSANPAVRALAMEAATIKLRLIEITEQEVTLLQRQITATRNSTEKQQQAATVEPTRPPQEPAIESKPLRSYVQKDSDAVDAKNVERLHGLLENYYAEAQEAASILPTDDEIAARKAAELDAKSLQQIPYSVDKVRLSGAEGSMALAQISRRLMDPMIPESRRDTTPICLIKTHLFDMLVVSENRSLLPVGKNHYIARVRLQPGDTTLNILKKQWTFRLPQHTDARDFLMTLYQPAEGEWELHVFAVDDLLAQENAHIPAWLPRALNLRTKSG
ncbi:MAG: hypothetical protein HRT77_09945 [Halioglobus sp.]|nr:hypothetical protein [Halioglobus sp.]